jgi:hypothetical protein
MASPWLYYGSALALLWLRPGFAMASLWLRYVFAMVLLWLRCGFDMTSLWLRYGVAMVLLWLCYGSAMVVLWRCYGFAMVCRYGVAMVLPIWFADMSARHLQHGTYNIVIRVVRNPYVILSTTVPAEISSRSMLRAECMADGLMRTMRTNT